MIRLFARRSSVFVVAVRKVPHCYRKDDLTDGAATMNIIGRSAATAGIMAAIGVIAHFACYRAIVRQAGGGRG